MRDKAALRKLLSLTLVVAATMSMASQKASQTVQQDSSKNSSTKKETAQSSGYAAGDIAPYADPAGVPNPVIIKETSTIELSAVGMGVAPQKTISKAQAVAMAKRAAIIDAYRQMGEKLHGVKIEGRETVKDMVLQNSLVETRIRSVIKNAEVVESSFEDGLCQVKMQLKINPRRWSYLLAGI